MIEHYLTLVFCEEKYKMQAVISLCNSIDRNDTYYHFVFRYNIYDYPSHSVTEYFKIIFEYECEWDFRGLVEGNTSHIDMYFCILNVILY